MGWIILLIVLGLVLYFAELVLLPGITLAAIGAFGCFTSAVTLGFMWFDLFTGFIILGICIILICVTTVIFLRPRTWKNAALHTNITETIGAHTNTLVPLDTKALTLTRLAPMGKVIIEGKTYEAKSLDSYIDQRSEVVVIDYDNQTLVVRAL